MADNVVVSNTPTSSNPDIATRTSETAAGKHIQHMRLDLGTGTTEEQAEGYVPVAQEAGSTTATALNTFPVPGANALIALLADALGNSPLFKSTGETPVHVGSVNNTLANSSYLLVDGSQYLITRNKATTSSISSVAGSASSVTLLSSSGTRLGATIYNDSTAVLYVKFGTTASTTSFTIKLQPDGYYEVPSGYTGRIDGIWASATGSARITELSA